MKPLQHFMFFLSFVLSFFLSFFDPCPSPFSLCSFFHVLLCLLFFGFILCFSLCFSVFLPFFLVSIPSFFARLSFIRFSQFRFSFFPFFHFSFLFSLFPFSFFLFPFSFVPFSQFSSLRLFVDKFVRSLRNGLSPIFCPSCTFPAVEQK